MDVSVPEDARGGFGVVPVSLSRIRCAGDHFADLPRRNGSAEFIENSNLHARENSPDAIVAGDRARLAAGDAATGLRHAVMNDDVRAEARSQPLHHPARDMRSGDVHHFQ